MGPEGGRPQGQDGPRSPPPRPRLASGPRPRCVPRPAPRRPPLPGCSGRGGEGKEPARRRGGLNPAPPPSCGPRGRRGSPPAPCSPVCWPARRPCPGAAAACSGPCGRRAGSRSVGPRHGGVCGAGGGRGQARPQGRGAQCRVGRSRASPGVSPVRYGAPESREARPWLAGTDPECWQGPKRAAESRASAGGVEGCRLVVVGPLCHLGWSLDTEDLLSARSPGGSQPFLLRN